MKISKIVCLLLASVMLFSLCACGDSTSSASGTQSSADGSSASETVTSSETDEKFAVGTTVNKTYENAYFGIGVTLDDNWVFKTQEEINELNGMVKDVLDKDTYTKALENGTVYNDMIAYADDGLINIGATIEKLNALSTAVIDEEGYIDAAMKNNDFNAIFAETGVDLLSVEKGAVTVAGEKHPCLVLQGTVQGAGFYQKVAAIKKGSYVLALTVTCTFDDTVDDVFAYFYAL